MNIDNGKITSTDFNIASVSTNSFTLLKINCILVFTESIKKGGINISFTNSLISTTFNNSIDFTNVIATIKVIYKEVLV